MKPHPVEPAEAKTLLGFLFVRRNMLLKGTAVAFLRSLAVAPCPWLFRVVIEHNIPAGDVVGIFVIALIFIGLLAVFFGLARIGARYMGAAQAELVRELRARVYRKLEFLSFGYLDQQRTGRLISKYATDTTRIEGCVMQILNTFLPSVLTSILVLAVLLLMEWRLSLILLLVLPIHSIARMYFFGHFKRQQREMRLANERLMGTASEYISALRLVRSFGAERQARGQLDSSSLAVAQARVDLVNISQTFAAFAQASTQLLNLVVVVGGAILVIQGHITFGTMFMFMAATPFINQPIQQFGQVSEQYFQGQEGYRSIKELLDSKYVDSWKGTARPTPLRGDVLLDEVVFSYRDGDRPAINDITLHIKSGERIALVGPSGSGKSTIANLVLGLYRPQKGIISIDGIPQDMMDMRWLRRQTAIVMQENPLLSGSVADNIRFARPKATDEEIRHAARIANAEEFILRLPQGYDTPVGERGVALSGGQRQRVSIARAILRDPPLLILDEATSALDYESERQIQEALERLARGRTVITIAHRLSTIRNADRIVVMREGSIIEQGSFTELAQKGGEFSRMLHAQEFREESTSTISSQANEYAT